MPQMEVSLIDQAGRTIKVRLPDDLPVGQLSSAITKRLDLPDTDKSGSPQRMVLHHKASGNDLHPDRTLNEQGVQDGAVIRIRMEAIAG